MFFSASQPHASGSRLVGAMATLALLACGQPHAQAQSAEVSCASPRGEGWYACDGIVGVRTGLVRELEAAAQHTQSARHAELFASIELVGVLGVREALPALRQLATAPDESVAATAIDALGALGDESVGADLVAIARVAEASRPVSWERSVAALIATRSPMLPAYIHEVAARLDVATSVGAVRARLLLSAILSRPDAVRAASPVLREWAERTPQTAPLAALITAARMRSSDPAFRLSQLPHLENGNEALPQHVELVVDGLGYAREDLQAVLRITSYSDPPVSTHAYAALERWVLAFGGELPRREREELLARLDRFLPHYDGPSADLARLRGVQALLGVRDATAQLEALTTEDPLTPTPWVAAARLAALRVEGANRRAAQVAAMGASEDASEEVWAMRAELLEALARFAASEGELAVSLFDRDPLVRRRALAILARTRPPKACVAVARMAGDAEPERARAAMRALSVLGEHCTDELTQLARDERTPASVRELALDAIACIPGATLPPGSSAGVLEHAARVRALIGH